MQDLQVKLLIRKLIVSPLVEQKISIYSARPSAVGRPRKERNLSFSAPAAVALCEEKVKFGLRGVLFCFFFGQAKKKKEIR
ncbi:MAG: hypothetical protein ACYC1Q_13895 [Bacteroidia bacterium]